MSHKTNVVAFNEKAWCVSVTAEGAFLLSSPGLPLVSPSFSPQSFALPVFALDLPAAPQRHGSHFHSFPESEAAKWRQTSY